MFFLYKFMFIFKFMHRIRLSDRPLAQYGLNQEAFSWKLILLMKQKLISNGFKSKNSKTKRS